MIKGDKVPFKYVPFFWTVQYGKSFRYCGYGANFDECFIRGELNEYSFEVYYGINDRIVAIATMGRDPITARASVLFKDNLMPKLSDLKAGLSIDAIKS